MFAPKFTALLCVILCITYSKTTHSQSNNSAFSFTLSSASRTSAGVYKTDSTLVRTLWADKNYAAGTYTEYWDGKDDYGTTISSPDPGYIVKVLTSNVKYNWDGIIGNTSAAQTGSSVHHGYYTSMTGMAITGNTAYFCQGYSENYSSQSKFSTNAAQVRLDLNGFGGKRSTLNTDFVATDGSYVYWAGYNAYGSANSFVMATDVSDDSQVDFGSNGSSYTMTKVPNAMVYTSVIDQLNIANSKPTGLAVQPSGNYLFVAHGGLNELHVLNKTTGALVQTLTYNDPRGLAVDGGYLWMVTGTNNVAKYSVNSNGTLSAVVLTLSGIITPGAIAVNGTNVAIIDEGTQQIVRFYNTSTGVQGSQLGTTGGYSNSPDVTNTKFMFNDFRGNTNSFIAYQNDGSFWIGDGGNFRELHYNSSKGYIEYIMSMGNAYSVTADPNNINRVFCHYLEFAINYTQPVSGSTGWTLAKNWGFLPAAQNANGNLRQLLNVVTLSNGRTYGQATGIGYAELTSTGLRSCANSPGGSINTDGSVMKVSGSNALGGNIVFTKYPLTGFDGSGNPIWSTTGILLATTPDNTLADPNINPGSINPVSYNYVTSSNKIIFYNDQKYYNGNSANQYLGYHLGAIKKGQNSWTWETQITDDPNYQGAFPDPAYFEVGNGGNQYAGSSVNVVDNNIITGYHGEFWKNAQTNYYNHYYEDGLAIGQFGTDGYISGGTSAAGKAGNALTPCLVKDASGNLYLYHGDESNHGGLHRWSITNLNTIKEQYINIPYPSSNVRPSFGYLDLHAGLPFDATLSNIAGWTKSGTIVSNTSQKKYINDGSPDVFSIFNQSSGAASINRDLGVNNVNASWKISGMLSFEGSDFIAGSHINSYVDVLDASSKILARFYYDGDYSTKIVDIFGNTGIIASATGLSATLNQMQPFEISCINGTINFTYANFSATSTSIMDGTANWKTPKTLRQYWTTGGTPAYNKNIGFMDMKFYKDYTLAANLPPIANAGPDQIITLPLDIVSLAGSGGDADGTIVSYSWSKISGPSSFNVVNASSPVTDISGLINGVYKFQLAVTDNKGAIGLDTIQITVNSPANIPPVVDAGQDIIITLPANTASLKGAATDSDGTITGYMWSKISGPSSYNIVSIALPATNITGLVLGTYLFELKVTDNSGATSRDSVTITVVNAANLPPVAKAGKDQVVSLPKNTLQLVGTGTDADGVIATYLWTKISGPVSGIIASATYPTTSVNTLIQGFYSFELMVTDNKGAVGRDTMVVTVVPASLPLKLLSFSGHVSSEDVDLSWETTNEKNVLGFDIERNNGGVWSKIGFIASSSTNALSNHYNFTDVLPESGMNYYRLKIVDIDGKFVYSDIINFNILPGKTLINQNFPNPFSSVTNIKFELAEKSPVKIVVYNVIGIPIAVLVDEIKLPGVYEIKWNAGNVADGSYYYQVVIGENIITKKLLKLH